MSAPAAGYQDIGRGGGFNSYREPKLGAYAPGAAWQDPEASKSGKKKWIVIGSIIGIIAIIVIATVVGVVVSNSHKKGNSKNLSATNSSASPNSSVQQTDPNDPSKFTLDPNLHKAFYGMAYTPVGSQLPDCGNSLCQSCGRYSRVRLYGADCNQSALVLEAIKQTKVDMTVYLGNYVIPTDNNAAYQRQRDVIKSAITTYGTDHIGGITVGNEFMLNYVTDNAPGDPNAAVNSDIGNTGAQILIANIQDTRNMLSSMGVSIPVGNSDAGSYFNNEVLAAVDYGMANVHPWFAAVSAEDGAAWTATFFQQTDVDQANALSNKPKMYIAETGWPTKSSDAAHASNNASTASEQNLQTFLDTFVCAANNNGTGYFFFEFADEDWKDKQFGGVEGWWGLFNQDRTLKNVKIPTCISP
ncbi:glycoside hydrolase [Agrocybe pediades]|nr:glycoside hydrolase [Agrocybe pediades]